MIKKTILFLAAGSAIFLGAAGILFHMWMPSPEVMHEIQSEVQYIDEHFIEQIAYVFSVVLSCFMLLPVIICFIIRNYKQYTGTVITGGVIIILGFLFDAAANLYSLSLWASAIPESLKGSSTGFMLYRSIFLGFLSLDFFAVALVYTGALIYGFGLRKISKLISSSMLLSVTFLIASFIFNPYIRIISIAFMIGSFAAYGAGIFGIGLAAVKNSG